jgi:hypothetical protein
LLATDNVDDALDACDIILATQPFPDHVELEKPDEGRDVRECASMNAMLSTLDAVLQPILEIRLGIEDEMEKSRNPVLYGVWPASGIVPAATEVGRLAAEAGAITETATDTGVEGKKQPTTPGVKTKRGKGGRKRSFKKWLRRLWRFRFAVRDE